MLEGWGCKGCWWRFVLWILIWLDVDINMIGGSSSKTLLQYPVEWICKILCKIIRIDPLAIPVICVNAFCSRWHNHWDWDRNSVRLWFKTLRIRYFRIHYIIGFLRGVVIPLIFPKVNPQSSQTESLGIPQGSTPVPFSHPGLLKDDGTLQLCFDIFQIRLNTFQGDVPPKTSTGFHSTCFPRRRLFLEVRWFRVFFANEWLKVWKMKVEQCKPSKPLSTKMPGWLSYFGGSSWSIFIFSLASSEDT